jgi:hypothetical protein
MNVIRVIAILGLAVGFSASTLSAAEGDKPKRPSLEELDKNGDGALSKEELEAVPEKFRARLLENDADKDGALSKEEFAKAKEAAAKRRAEREANGGKPPGEKPPEAK